MSNSLAVNALLTLSIEWTLMMLDLSAHTTSIISRDISNRATLFVCLNSGINFQTLSRNQLEFFLNLSSLFHFWDSGLWNTMQRFAYLQNPRPTKWSKQQSYFVHTTFIAQLINSTVRNDEIRIEIFKKHSYNVYTLNYMTWESVHLAILCTAQILVYK